MQTSIAQTLALVVFGNRYLDGRSVEAFWPSATVFAFCRNIQFLDRRGQIVASNPKDWFAMLKAEQSRPKWFGKSQNGAASGLRLRYSSGGKDDRMNVGFVGGGGRWQIEDISRDRCSLWEGHWSLGDRNAADRKIWDVSYNSVGDAEPSPSQTATVIRGIRDRLDLILREIEVFARDAGATQFADCFKSAHLALTSADPLNGLHHREFQDADLALPAKQLLGAMFHGWVFGGMGSWNDGPTGDSVRYETLSSQLFEVLTQGTVAVANSTYAARP